MKTQQKRKKSAPKRGRTTSTASKVKRHPRSGRTQPKLRQPLDRSIVLVGLMGCGKSTIGIRLAKRLGWTFVDSDTEIETAAGQSITEIFEKFGEDEFRKGERRVMKRLLDGTPQVIATGGGAFMDEETRTRIKDCALSVWLKADVPLLVERTSRKDTRPLLKEGNPAEILRALADKRYPIYAEANLTVETGLGPHDDVVDSLIEAINNYLATGPAAGHTDFTTTPAQKNSSHD